MNTHLLIVSAFRTLLMGFTLFAVLRLLRIHQVRAQRTAWILSLIAALAMPAIVGLHIGLPVLPATMQQAILRWKPTTTAHAGALQGGTKAGDSSFALTSVSPRLQSKNSAGPMTASSAPSASGRWLGVASNAGPSTTLRSARDDNGSALSQMPARSQMAERAPAPARSQRLSYAMLLYLAVAACLLIRLSIGLFLAMQLRRQARRIVLSFDPLADVRVSNRIATPVTVSETILIPERYSTWEPNTLRIVLTHERAHVRQGDFYIQLLAAIHCAIFWFNPFSWWLQRQLSALGEAMSDLAAVQQAESRASYAEVLLQFATSARWPVAGVAMARTSNLHPRIERVLNDQLFLRCASNKKGIGVMAAGIALIALIASTSLVRVQAAQLPSVQAPTAPTPPTPPSQEAAPAPVPAVPTPPEPAAEPLPAPESAATPPTPPEAPAAPDTEAADSTSNTQTVQMESSDSGSSKRSGYSYSRIGNGEVFALVTGGDSFTFTGDWHDMKAFDAIRSSLHGDYIYYQHAGKSYVLQDPALLARAKALYVPLEILGKQQDALGKQQDALGKQQEVLGKMQEDLGRQTESVKIATPDMSKELASLDKAMEQMKQMETAKEVNQESLSQLQEQIGQIQGRLGELQGMAGEQQGKFGAQQGELGARQGKLGAEQGKLGAEQGRLGERQGKLGREAERQLTPLIEQAIRDGKARPID